VILTGPLIILQSLSEEVKTEEEAKFMSAMDPDGIRKTISYQHDV
jgi:hypothetical protein